MSERKLATIRKITEINPIEGADNIEVASVDGWKVVVKKGEFEEGELVVFCEIDSWIPHELAPFLSKGKEPREYNGVKGERLRTVKLRGQLSQGLVLPVFKDDSSPYIHHIDGNIQNVSEGQDVTQALGILKWEPPVSPDCSAKLGGQSKGSFPSLIPKTDQERVQNIKSDLFFLDSWEVTEKLEGSSMTCYLINGEFGVCSRNIDLKRNEDNAFWEVAIRLGIESQMRSNGMDNFAIQGELVGPGVQGNIYNLSELDFFVYDVYDIKRGNYVSPWIRTKTIMPILELKHVPIISNNLKLCCVPIKENLLSMAEGHSELFMTQREGLVFKSLTDPNKSFKVVSNKYLLGEK